MFDQIKAATSELSRHSTFQPGLVRIVQIPILLSSYESWLFHVVNISNNCFFQIHRKVCNDLLGHLLGAIKASYRGGPSLQKVILLVTKPFLKLPPTQEKTLSNNVFAIKFILIVNRWNVKYFTQTLRKVFERTRVSSFPRWPHQHSPSCMVILNYHANKLI